MRDTSKELAFVPDTDWRTIDATIVTLAQKKGALEVEIARWLLAAQRERLDRRLGYGSFAEYVQRRFGYDAHVTREKLRVARALETLPQLGGLLRAGKRTWSAVREMTRAATPETEAEWIETTERMTVREIENLLRGRKKGELPDDEKDPLLTPRRLVFELLPEDFAIIEDENLEMDKQPEIRQDV